MRIVYVREKLNAPKFSVFLAGPTPRVLSVKSWRPEFVNLLKSNKFKGSVLIPEEREIGATYDFDKQIPWEVKHLNEANLIAFWIPRKLDTMPAFTTNIEFGEFMHSKKIAVGFPSDSVNNRYISRRCEMSQIPLFQTLEDLAVYVCKEEQKFLQHC
jgi:hypothetical protein